MLFWFKVFSSASRSCGSGLSIDGRLGSRGPRGLRLDLPDPRFAEPSMSDFAGAQFVEVNDCDPI